MDFIQLINENVVNVNVFCPVTPVYPCLNILKLVNYYLQQDTSDKVVVIAPMSTVFDILNCIRLH